MKTTDFAITLLLLLGALAIGCKEPKQRAPHLPKRTQALSTQVFYGNNGWGYQILVNKDLLIYQNTIPGIEGNIGFHQASDAAKIANLVTWKLSMGKSPSISLNELDSLNIRI